MPTAAKEGRPALHEQPSKATVSHRKKYNIPVRFLRGLRPDIGEDPSQPEHESRDGDGAPDHPVLVFINPKSGGKVGPLLQKLLNKALGELQVFDVSQADSRPDKVLKRLFENLKEAEKAGDEDAKHVLKRLRIVAAGGDGTVAWVLSTIRQLDLQPPPPVGVIPLGTGNGMSVNFGWGNRTQPRMVKGRDKADKELEATAAAEVRPLDGWEVEVVAEDKSLIGELPHSIHKVEGTDKETGPNGCRCKGLFWYYLTVGLDAEVAYRFHSLREKHPWLSPTRKTNIWWYFWSTCRTGWFCYPRPLNRKLKLRQRDASSGDWRDIDIPNTVVAIIFINLQTYGGSRDLWGLHDDRQDKERGHSVPIYDDGKLEVIGLESAGKSILALTNIWRRIHGKRIAQGSEFELEMARPGDGVTHMRVDGEPWEQRLPDSKSADAPLRVHIKLEQPARVLVNTTHLPPKNESTRAAADAAGTGKSGESFQGDGETVVASTPRAGAASQFAPPLPGPQSFHMPHGMLHS